MAVSCAWRCRARSRVRRAARVAVAHAWRSHLLVPERVDCIRGGGDLILSQLRVRRVDRVGEAREDPRVRQRRQVGARATAGGDETEGDWQGARLEMAAALGREVQEGEARGVPQLVAEAGVAGDAVDIEVDVLALARVREQPEAQRIRAALRDALRIFALVVLRRLLELRAHETARENDAGEQRGPAQDPIGEQRAWRESGGAGGRMRGRGAKTRAQGVGEARWQSQPP